MGYSALARWINSPTNGLDLITENITKNHHGAYVGKWQLSVRSYRSTFSQIPGFQIPSERSMFTLTMHEHVYVLLEDPLAPQRSEIIEMPQGPTASLPSHFRTTFLSLSPPNALEQLLSQLKARWVPVRQSNVPSRGQNPVAGQQLSVEGAVFAIGTDWLVRVGNVILTGGAIKGMLLEAEYLPIPVLHSPPGYTSELLSNLLTSVLPNVPDARMVAITISDAQWEDVLWDREEEARQQEQGKKTEDEDDGDLYVSLDQIVTKRPGDWVGIDRDRRSAFLIIGSLRSEGIL